MPYIDSTVIIEKRAGEKLLCGFDFGPWLSSGETITGITSVVGTGDEGSVTISDETVSGTRVVFYIEGGTPRVRYAITCTITTSLNQILIGEGPLKVM